MPTHGEVIVGGEHLETLSGGQLTKWRGSHIGFIFQFYNLMPMLSAAGNVELPLLLTSLSKSERRRRVAAALEIVGLSDRAAHKPGEMSGGQQQRVGIARAIVADPAILLCDEPTGDLDRATADEILGLLQQLNRQHNKTIVMVTHDPKAADHATPPAGNGQGPAGRTRGGGMKYVPLVWAAVMRKPVRAVLTLLSVMIAFTLFGLTIGMNATFDEVQKAARADRVYTNLRFAGDGLGLPIAMARQMAGPARRGAGGLYFRHSGISPGAAQPHFRTDGRRQPGQGVDGMADHARRNGTRCTRPATASWSASSWRRNGTSSRATISPWQRHRSNVPTAPTPGLFAWSMSRPDVAYMSAGFMLGNYQYLNKARPPAQQDHANQVFVQSSTPDGAAAMAQTIDQHFASSAVPTQSTTEKAALDVSNSGIDIAAVDIDIALAGMFMVLFLTANGIAQSVRERFTEFATLKTMGFSDKGVLGAGLPGGRHSLPAGRGAGRWVRRLGSASAAASAAARRWRAHSARQ